MRRSRRSTMEAGAVVTEQLRVPIDLGDGPVVVMLPGFALSPELYRRTAELLARRGRCRVVIPDLYRVPGGWDYDTILVRLQCTLDARDMERVTMIAHSFAGGIQLGFATRWPGRVLELVFADTLAVSREWPLAREATRHPFRLLRMATPNAAAAFSWSVLTHPREVLQAGWWGFTSDRGSGIDAIAAHRLPAHVLWANRDSLLSQSDGRAFAHELGASFDVVRVPDGRPVDHDWMYRQPELFVAQLAELHLAALE
jgi:pimeloyl-ACP methyl ester carboxylesterase